jgi:hypothetical protein
MNVSDFGLARQDLYNPHASSLIPIKYIKLLRSHLLDGHLPKCSNEKNYRPNLMFGHLELFFGKYDSFFVQYLFFQIFEHGLEPYLELSNKEVANVVVQHPGSITNVDTYIQREFLNIYNNLKSAQPKFIG